MQPWTSKWATEDLRNIIEGNHEAKPLSSFRTEKAERMEQPRLLSNVDLVILKYFYHAFLQNGTPGGT